MADADILLNEISEQRGPLPMAINKDINYTLPTKIFYRTVSNIINPSLFSKTRAKDFTVRLLDARKTEDERTIWQFSNIGLPVILVNIFGAIYQAIRKRNIPGVCS